MKGYLIMTGFDNSMRSLASIGVVDFDANAYVKGTKPMYVGSPEPHMELPLDAPITSTPNFGYGYGYGGGALRAQPSVDAFVSRGHHSSSVSAKGLILGGILGALGLTALTSFLTKGKNSATDSTSTNVAANAGQAIKNSPIYTKTKGFVSTAISKAKAMPWQAKAAIAVAGVGTVLYGFFKAITHTKVEHPQLPEGNSH